MHNQLALQVAVSSGSVELRVLVDGRDVVADVFESGPNGDPDELLQSLVPERHSHEVRLAEAHCTEECCGAIYVSVAQDGDEIVLDGWRNSNVIGVDLAQFRFDAGQYRAELARVDRERDWEWPGRTVTRLVRGALRDDPDVLAEWNSSLDFLQCRLGSRDEIEFVFTSPPRETVNEFYRIFERPMEHRQFRLRIPITDQPAPDQAEELVDVLAAADPRERAEICGGYGNPIM